MFVFLHFDLEFLNIRRTCFFFFFLYFDLKFLNIRKSVIPMWNRILGVQ